MADIPGYWTFKDAQAATGFSRNWLWRLLDKGAIEGQKVGNTWILSKASIDQYLRHRDKPGRPKVKK